MSVPGASFFASEEREEAELGGLADDQTEFAIRHLRRGAFFHAERRDGQRFDRRGNAGHGGHGGFDSDVIRARDAAANAHAFAVPRRAVISRSARDRVHQIFAGERLDCGRSLLL